MTLTARGHLTLKKKKGKKKNSWRTVKGNIITVQTREAEKK